MWPLVARAQQGDRTRRIGVLMAFDETDPDAKTYLAAFSQELLELGRTDGRICEWMFVGVPAALTGCECSRRSWSTCDPT